MYPIKPEPRDGYESLTIAASQPEYLPLEANVKMPITEVKYKLRWYERIQVATFGYVHFYILRTGPLQPILPNVKRLSTETLDELVDNL